MSNILEHALAAVVQKRMPGFLSYLVEDLGVSEFTTISLSGSDNNRLLFANARNDKDLILQDGILPVVSDAEDPTTFSGALLRDKNWTFSNYSTGTGSAVLSNRDRAKGFFGGDQRKDPKGLNGFAKAIFDPMNVMRAVGKLNGKWAVYSDKYSGDNRKSHAHAYFDDNPEVLSILSSIASTHGYEVNTAYPLIAGPTSNNRQRYVTDPVPTVKWDSGYGGTAMGGAAGPGVKYIVIMVTTVTTRSGALSIGLKEYWDEGIPGALSVIPHSGQHGTVNIMVPVIDDGLPTSIGITVLAASHSGSDGSVNPLTSSLDVQAVTYNYHSIPDYRYGGGNTPGLTYSPGVVSAFAPRIKDIDGKPFKLSAITSTNWGETSSAMVTQMQAKLFWPLVVPMGSVGCIYQGTHVYAGSTDLVYTTRSGGERVIKMHNYNLEVERMGLQFSKEWYSNYYTRGFGIYQPRASKERQKVLEEWSKLEWDNFYVFRSNEQYSFSTNDLRDLDIYRDYGKVRDKACKTNNFLELPFNDKISWKAAGERLEAMGPINEFFAVRSGQAVTYDMSSTIGALSLYSINGPITDGQITIVDDGGKSSKYKVASEDTIELVLMINSSGGTLNNIDISEIVTDAGLLSESGSMQKEMREMSKIVKFSNDPQMDGYHPSISYNSTWTQLTKSGYPVVDRLSKRERTYCALTSIITLRTMGSRIMKVYNDITTNAILAKA